jgi:hypothetical protein
MAHVIRRWSQWPHGLRHELSLPARTLGSWVWIPFDTWMSLCIYCMFVLSCVHVVALRQAEPPSKESYWLYKRSRNWKSGQGPTKGCKARMDGRTDRRMGIQTERQTDRQMSLSVFHNCTCMFLKKFKFQNQLANIINLPKKLIYIYLFIYLSIYLFICMIGVS